MAEILYQSYYSLEDCEEIIKILNAHQIPFRIHKEAQVGIKVYTGETFVKDVHLFINSEDVEEVSQLLAEEMPEPDLEAYSSEDSKRYYDLEEDNLIPEQGMAVPLWMLVMGYLTSIAGMLVGLIFALKIYNSKTSEGKYHYNKYGRRHAVNMLIIIGLEFIAAVVYLYSHI